MKSLRDRVVGEVGKVVVGQDDVVESLVAALLVGGHVLLEGVPGVAKTLVANATAPFEVTAQGVSAFPSLARPRVIWIGLHGDPLTEMAARVAEAAGRCGFALERRAYSPHLTIGRMRSLKSPGRLRRTLEAVANSSFGVSRIERMMLYRSVPGRPSSTYHELAAFPFA